MDSFVYYAPLTPTKHFLLKQRILKKNERKKERKTLKTGTQISTQDSTEIQHVLQFALNLQST